MIQEQERLSILVELIARDLKIHKHLHFLEQSGLETFHLQLNIHNEIFRLVGIEKSEIDEDLRDRYYQMAEKSIDIDVFNDKEKLFEAAKKILDELSKNQLNKT